MKSFIPTILFVLALAACTNQVSDDNGIEEVPQTISTAPEQIMVDKIYVGMEMDEMKRLYPKAEFIEEPIYMYGVDGESNGIVVVVDSERLFFVWALEERTQINAIAILSPKIKIDGDVHVGMSLADFLKKYPNRPLEIDVIDNNYEFTFVEDLGYRVEFLTTDSTRVAEYNYNAPEPEFIRVVRPEAKVDMISIY